MSAGVGGANLRLRECRVERRCWSSLPAEAKEETFRVKLRYLGSTVKMLSSSVRFLSAYCATSRPRYATGNFTIRIS